MPEFKPDYEDLEDRLFKCEKELLRSQNNTSENPDPEDTFLSPEDQLRALMENSRDYILISNDKGVPQFFNTAYAELMKEFLGFEMQPGIQPHKLLEDHQAVAYWDKLHQRVLSGEKFKAEYSHRFKEKGLIHFEISFSPIYRNGSVSGFTEITRDVSDLKEKETELKKSTERYQRVSDLTSDYAYSFLVKENGEIENEWVTGALERITGYSKKELQDKGGWETLIYPPDMKIPLGQLQMLMKGESATVEYRIQDKAGEILWVLDYARPIMDDKTGRISQIYGAVRDITKSKQAELDVIEKATVIEQAVESIIITDRNGSIAYVNPAFEKISGYTREELVNKNFRIFKSKAHDTTFYQKMWHQISKGEVWTGNIINKMKQGHYCEFETTISPLKNAEGRVIRFVSINRDVTQEKALEARLVQAQKMEAIGTLAGGIAHDFNNILSGIMGFTELALMEKENPGEIEDNLTKTLRACDRAKDLVQQILTFSRQDEIQHKPVKIKPIVMDAVKLLRSTLPTTIEIRHELASNATIMADESQIHHVLMNLSVNAGHAMRHEGGVL